MEIQDRSWIIENKETGAAVAQAVPEHNAVLDSRLVLRLGFHLRPKVADKSIHITGGAPVLFLDCHYKLVAGPTSLDALRPAIVPAQGRRPLLGTEIVGK